MEESQKKLLDDLLQKEANRKAKRAEYNIKLKESGKAAEYRKKHTEAGKTTEYNKKYRQTEKGKETQKIAHDKYIKTDKGKACLIQTQINNIMNNDIQMLIKTMTALGYEIKEPITQANIIMQQPEPEE